MDIASRTRLNRANETSERRQARLAIDRERKRRLRQRENEGDPDLEGTSYTTELRRERDMVPRVVEENYLGTMTVVCQHCNACFFKQEVKGGAHHINVCCNFGNIDMPYKFSSYPPFIKDLLTENTPDGKNFRENIRQYNTALSMASMGAQFDVPRSRGPYCFRIHGQVYHYAGPLHPEGDRHPVFGQIYILDTRQAAQERMNIAANTNCRVSLMHELSDLLSRINQYAQSFRMMAY